MLLRLLAVFAAFEATVALLHHRPRFSVFHEGSKTEQSAPFASPLKMALGSDVLNKYPTLAKQHRRSRSLFRSPQSRNRRRARSARNPPHHEAQSTHIERNEADLPRAQPTAPPSDSTGLDLATIGIPSVAASRTAGGGAGVAIYVLDSGVNTRHSVFGGRAVPGYHSRFNSDGYFSDGYECQPTDHDCSQDDYNHGTWVASKAAGRYPIGVAPNATIISVKVTNATGHHSTQKCMIGGLHFAIRHHKQYLHQPGVAVMSFGSFGMPEKLDVTYSAIGFAVRIGLTIVTAAGNHGSWACFGSPGRLPETINVGAVDANNHPAAYSNYGECVDIWAPGSASPLANKDSNDTLDFKDGTSYAAPMVAGVAALELARSGVNYKRLYETNSLQDVFGAVKSLLLQNAQRVNLSHPFKGLLPILHIGTQ